MEVVRKYMDAKSLMSIMALPEAFHNRRLEVIVLPVEEPEKEKTATESAEIDRALSVLAGAVPYTELSLEELREERLKKYEAID